MFEIVIGEKSGATGEDRWSLLLGVPNKSKDGKGGEGVERGEILVPSLEEGLGRGEVDGETTLVLK